MGVPRLGYYIQTSHPDTLLEKVNEVDHLYIDTNALIHPIAQEVFRYGKIRLNPIHLKQMNIPQLSYEDKEELLFSKLYEEIVKIYKFVNPKKRLYVAIDGVAPVAKMVQQRQRRFLANSIDNKSIGFRTVIPSIDDEFNPNSITCGTMFMSRLVNSLTLKFKQGEIPIKIVFSTHRTPGEGEHKLVKSIRKLIQDSHLIYGPDGDLIILGLGLTLTSENNIYLMKNKWNSKTRSLEKNLYDIIDLQLLSKNISSRMNLRDFILLTTLLGNDFIPKLEMFELVERDIELMFRVYKEFLKTKENNKVKSIVNEKNEIDEVGLFGYLFDLSRHEETHISTKAERNPNSKFFDSIIKDCIKTNAQNEEEFDMKKYIEKFNKIRLNRNVKKACSEYIKGMIWTYKYYVEGCPDYKWYYPFHRAPLLTCIIRIPILKPKFENTIPSDPFQQLLCVLPHTSKYLIPEEYQTIFDKLKDYYPNSFKVDYEGKYAEYQGIAILPFIDINKLQQCYQSIPIIKDRKRNLNTVKVKIFQPKSSGSKN